VRGTSCFVVVFVVVSVSVERLGDSARSLATRTRMLKFKDDVPLLCMRRLYFLLGCLYVLPAGIFREYYITQSKK